MQVEQSSEGKMIETAENGELLADTPNHAGYGGLQGQPRSCANKGVPKTQYFPCDCQTCLKKNRKVLVSLQNWPISMTWSGVWHHVKVEFSTMFGWVEATVPVSNHSARLFR